jgi:hypothetical protein
MHEPPPDQGNTNAPAQSHLSPTHLLEKLVMFFVGCYPAFHILAFLFTQLASKII